MKGWHWILVSFIVSCIILGGRDCGAQDAGNLPDGLTILRDKMEKKEIPDADFSKFKFGFPESIPDEINIIKGFLWSGQHVHPVRRGGHGGAVTYLFLINYNKETGEMSVYRAAEKAVKTPSGWKILTGKIEGDSKRKIELTGKDGSIFQLVIDDRDHLTLSSPSGYDARMTKMGTISPPQ
jgi:hypothetical protein